LISDHIISLRTKATDARALHTTSIEFLRSLQAGNGDVGAITRTMMTFQGSAVSSGGVVHNVFCLDASGSMHSSWPDLVQALKQFIAVRQELGGNRGDLVTIIEFSVTPRVILQRVTLQQALDTPLANSCNGGTNYVPALAKCLEEIRADSSGLDTVLVFMTDGAPTDGNKTEIVPAVTALKTYKPSLAFFCVAFNCGLDGYLRQMADAAQGKAIAANGVDQLKNEFKTIAREVSAKYGR
jgi:Mg-chelatase subunit ChlD